MPMKNRGFTLVEMMVSLAIFSVVAVIAIGALLKVIDANKKSQSMQSAVTNINFAMESMSRDLRTGTSIQCFSSSDLSNAINNGRFVSDNVSACSIGRNQAVAFYSTRTNQSDSPACGHGLITAYEFNDISDGSYELQKAEQTSCGGPLGQFSDLISPDDMTIDNYELGVLYAGNGTNPSYPLTFIRITGHAGERVQDQTLVDLETAVSARTSQ